MATPCRCKSGITVRSGGADTHLTRPIRPEHQETGGGPPAGQQRQQIQRRMIAPVQVFEHQHQRPLGGQGVQHFGPFPQHTLPRRPLEFVVQLRPVRGREQPGHLHQPGGGLLPQQCHQARPLRPPAELAQRLQDRQVRFPVPIGLDTLAVRHPHGGPRRGLRGKRLHDGGLADARLSGDQDHLPDPLLRLRQGPVELLQHRLPLDEQGRGPRRGAAAQARREAVAWTTVTGARKR